MILTSRSIDSKTYDIDDDKIDSPRTENSSNCIPKDSKIGPNEYSKDGGRLKGITNKKRVSSPTENENYPILPRDRVSINKNTNDGNNKVNKKPKSR